MEPDPVEVVGGTRGIRIHHRRSGGNRGVERSGTAAVAAAAAAGIPYSIAGIAVAAELAAVGEGRCHGDPMAGRVGREVCMWAWFPVRSGRRASGNGRAGVVTVVVVALDGAFVRLYGGGGESGRLG